MKYLAFIWADGMPTPKALAVMQRELPDWTEDMNGRGVRLFGRELDLPETAAVVRVRDGQTLVTDGPFAETKEFIAGFGIFEFADLDEAIEVAAKSPVSRFQALELRPVRAGLEPSEAAFAFGRGQDAAAPYLLSVWAGGTLAAPRDDQALQERCEAWRLDLQARGLHILGQTLGDGRRPRRSGSATAPRCSAPVRNDRTASTSPTSRSSAAPADRRRSNSRRRIPSPGSTPSRYGRSGGSDPRRPG
jgi:hypothetical protein